MKETLTVRGGISDALARGDEALLCVMEVMEQGTAEDIRVDDVLRAAAVRWDILKRRALYPVREPTWLDLHNNAERLAKAGEIKPVSRAYTPDQLLALMADREP